MKNHLRNPYLRVGFLLSFLIVALVWFTAAFISNAKDQAECVRIGYHEGTNYLMVDQDGNKTGYGYEYMQELSKFAGWKCEYVPIQVWADCFTMLEEGKIDLLSPVQYTEERAMQYGFPEINMGNTYATLVVKSDNNQYIREDYANFNGIKVGSFGQSQNLVLLDEFAQKNNFTYEQTIYGSAEELNLALETGEIDAIVFSSLQGLSGKKVIAKFSVSPFYAITNKDNTELLERLNKAISLFEIRNPEFKTALYNKYYNANFAETVTLTKEEQSYIKANPVLKVVALPGARPFSYFEEGEYKGITADIVNAVAKDLGFTFTYIETDSYKESLEMIKSGKADIICNFAYDYNWGEINEVKFTIPYAEYFNSILINKQIQNPKTIATTEGYNSNGKVLSGKYTENEIIYCKTEEECVQTVLTGKSDMANVSTYVAESAMKQHYNKLSNYMVKDYRAEMSMGVGEDSDPLLYIILDKKINGLDQVVVSDAIAKYTDETYVQVTLWDYLYQNPIEIILTVIGIFMITIAVFVYIMKLRKKSAIKMQELAFVDDVTGLSTMLKFKQDVEFELKTASPLQYMIIAMDIDNFKYINSLFGYDAGNEVLRYFGLQLKKSVTSKTLIARIFADNFIIFAPTLHLDQIKENKFLSQGGLDAGNISKVLDNDYKMSYSTGIYVIEDLSLDIYAMVDYANIAKKSVKGYYEMRIAQFSPQMQKQLELHREITTTMEKALDNEEFLVYIQPKISLETKKVVGAEVLVRWDYPGKGLVAPDVFIPLFEKNCFIQKLDMYMFNKTCIFIRKLQDSDLEYIPRISVNVSKVTLVRDSFVEDLLAMSKKYGIDNKLMEIELTESVFSDNTDKVLDIMARLRKGGYFTSVDDFGSGYSSLNLLKDIQTDVLKIDMRFLSDSIDTEKGKMIISNVINLSKDLKLETVAEGVETLEQADNLLKMGCDIAQGYYFARPMPLADFEKMLYKNNKKA